MPGTQTLPDCLRVITTVAQHAVRTMAWTSPLSLQGWDSVNGYECLLRASRDSETSPGAFVLPLPRWAARFCQLSDLPACGHDCRSLGAGFGSNPYGCPPILLFSSGLPDCGVEFCVPVSFAHVQERPMPTRPTQP